MCVHESVALLCPSPLAWLLSRTESFLLVFGIHGNASLYVELAVFLCWSGAPSIPLLVPLFSLSPTALHFPYITHSSTTTSAFTFCLHVQHASLFPVFHSVALFSISLHNPYFLSIFSTDLSLSELPLHASHAPLQMSQINSFYIFFLIGSYCWCLLNLLKLTHSLVFGLCLSA